MQVHVKWTPGHAKVLGNERANTLTHIAAAGTHSPLNNLLRILL